MKILKAMKSAYVSARESAGGEKILTFASDGIETENITNCGDIVVTAINENGKPVLKNGYTNTWIVDQHTFNKKYAYVRIVEGGYRMYRSKGNEQTFVVLDHDTTFTAPWGEEQYIKKGGVLNISNFSDIYGIAEQEFKETYVVLEEKEF